MANEVIAQRACLKDISYNGKTIHLKRFVNALELVILTKGPYEAIPVAVIKCKIVGVTHYKIQNENKITGINKKLQEN